MINAYKSVFTKRLLTQQTLIAIVFMAVVAQSISSFLYQRVEQPERRMELLQSIQKQLDASEGRLADLQRQGLTLQGQNNELQQLSICLLQLIKGEDFTDRAECQRKIDEFESNPDRYSTTVQPQAQPNPAPQPQAQSQTPAQPQQPPQPPQPGLIQSTVDGLGDLLRRL